MKKSLSFIFCLVAYIGVRILLLFSTNNYIATWETVSTANIVFSKIYSFNQLFVGSIHPFYRILLKSFLSVFDNPLIYAPVFNFIISVLLAFAFYFCIREFFGKSNAVFSLFVLSFMPVISLQSVISTEIILMHFLLVLSFYTLKKYKNTKRKIFLLLFLIVLNLSHLTRFESWILVPCFIVWFFKGEDSLEKKVIVSFLMLFVPISSFVFKNPLADISEQSLNSLHAIKVIGENGFIVNAGLKGFLNWFIVMGQSVGIVFVSFSFLGLVFAFRQKKELFYCFSVSFLLLVFCLKSVKGDIIPHPRYITIVVLMLIPYVFYFIETFLKYLSFKKEKTVLIWGLALFFAANLFFLKIKVYGQALFSLSEAVICSSEYLYKDNTICDAVKEYVPKGANVFVDTDYYGRDYDDIIAYGINPDSNLICLEDSSFFEDKILAKNLARELETDILKHKPMYLVISEKGGFDFLFGKKPLFMQKAQELFKYKQWRIFYIN